MSRNIRDKGKDTTHVLPQRSVAFVSAGTDYRDGAGAVKKSKKQLVAETEEWIRKNPSAYRALVDATKAITDSGNDTPFKFLVEVLRYNGVLGEKVMSEVVEALSNVRFAKGEFAIPNEIVSGIARRIASDMEGYEGFHAVFKKSVFDEPDSEEVEQLALF